MKKIIQGMMLVMVVLMAILFFQGPAAALELFENKNVSITSSYPPQYLGWKVVLGSTTQNVAQYYKVAAVVPGFGETVASGVTTAYSTYAPLSSTNTLRLMWAPVDMATSYKLYKSANNSTFYLLATILAPTLTYIDDGSITLATAYSAPSPKTGNLYVENDVTVGGDLTVSGRINPYSTGTFTADNVSATYGVAAATGAFSAGVTVGTTLVVTGAGSAATINTGQGAYELYKMNQNVSMDASPTFVAVAHTGAITGATTIAVQGAAYFGSNANATVSTITAAGAASFAGSVTSAGTLTGAALNISGSGQVLLGNATSTEIKLLAPGQAKGAMIINSTTGLLCISTATVAGSWVKVSDAAACW